MTTTTRFVTTCHKAGWEQYGKKCLAGWHYLPQNAELWWYTEGYDLPATERVRAIDNATLANLQAFKQKYAFYKSPYYLWDVVRFAHKVYAVADALLEHDGIGVWMDADIVPYADVPDGYVESLLPAGEYLALFKRKGVYSECGFWIVDCRNEHHRAFLTAFRDWYDTDAFKRLPEWHDSYIMDVTRNMFERRNAFTSVSLSGEFEGEEHPMAFVELAQYLDHLKGPQRKRAGVSHENKHRRAAA